MSEPISREEFIVKAIKTHIDEKFEAHQKFEDVRYKNLDKVLTEHHTTLYGKSGDDTAVGLRIKVDRLNRLTKAVSLGAAAAFTAVGSYLGLK